MPSRSPFPVICLTCRQLVLRFFRVAGWIDYYPDCALRLPQGGRAITCPSYEREPGSDDEPIRMAQNPTPCAAPRSAAQAQPPGLSPTSDSLQVRTNLAAKIAKAARRPGRWPVVGVAT